LQKTLKKRWQVNFEQIKNRIDALMRQLFYKLAAKFGWQEAIIESYHRQNKQIWVNSEHINKYTRKKSDLMWVIMKI
jgi:hypothetical protein